jgi:predicted RNase H-like HicB family nuclease
MSQPTTFQLILVPQPEGGYIVHIPEVPSLHTEGDTRDDARLMAKDALIGYFNTLYEHGWFAPACCHEQVTIQSRSPDEPAPPGPAWPPERHRFLVHPDRRDVIAIPAHDRPIKPGLLLAILNTAGISRERLDELLHPEA